MTNEIRDKVTLSLDIKVAEIIAKDATGFKFEKYIPERQKEILEIAQKIVALFDEREVPGWVAKTDCPDYDFIPYPLNKTCIYKDKGSRLDLKIERLCSTCRAGYPAKQHEVNSGEATKEEG